MNIDVSFIIVSWNSRDLLVKCIDSILSRKLKIRYEVIVVDNASTDDSAETVRVRYPGIKLIENKENFGFAKSNNIGIRSSSGKYVCLINSDVEVLESCVDKLYDFMESDPSVGIVGPKIVGRDNLVQRSCMGFPTLWNLFSRAMALDLLFPRTKLFGSYMMTYCTHDSVREVDVINGCFWMVRRKTMLCVGLLDETFFIYAEDIDWCRRFKQSGARVIYYPFAEAIHYGGGSSKNAPIRFYMEMQKANFSYWKKYHNIASQQAYLLLRILHEGIRVVGHVVFAVLSERRRAISFEKAKRSVVSIQFAASSIGNLLFSRL